MPIRTPRAGPAAGPRTILRTERLHLRELALADVPFIAAMFEDDDARTFYPEMHRIENAERWVRRNIETYRTLGFGLWAIVLNESGQLAGDCGLVPRFVDGKDEIEVAYHLHADFRGRGIATEAAAACLRWGFDHLDCDRIVSVVHPRNRASRAVCKRVHRHARRFWRHGARHFLFFTNRPR